MFEPSGKKKFYFSNKVKYNQDFRVLTFLGIC